MKELIVITGPTAVGKTSVVLELAAKHGLEVISCDSRQFYREMNIGTAKPLPSELKRVPHHFINSLSVHEPYSAGTYEKEGLKVLSQCFEEKDQVLLTGGSGLYIKAICEGFDDFPDVDENIIQALENQPLDELQNLLKRKDPLYYDEVDLLNQRRIVRALSIIEVSGKPFSSFHKRKVSMRNFNIRYVVLERDRSELYNRINDRVDVMMKMGLYEEVLSLYPHRNLKALQTVGYQEIFAHIDGQTSLAEAVELIKRNTRRYAKRQLTWFRKWSEASWQHPSKEIEI